MEKRVSNTNNTIKDTTNPSKKIKKENSINPLALMMKTLPENILSLKYSGSKKKIDKSRLRISHWNVNGIRASLKKKEARDYFENTELDILCLNETKINKKKFLKSGIEKYNKFSLYQYILIKK